MTEENKTTDAPVPGSPDYPLHSELTIGAYLKQQVAIDPDHEFVVYPDRDLRWTYKDFDERTDNLARGLLAIGLRMKPGDHLGVWARNIPDWLTFMYASAKIGVVMVTVNPVYKSHELDYVLKQSDMKALCVIDAYRDLGLGDRFFTPMFEKLVGAGWVRGMIVAGASEEAIRARWVPDVERYREKRVQYLLYE